MRILAVSLILTTVFLCRTGFCDEIHDAAKSNDWAKVKALLSTNPELVKAKDNYGWMPLHFAAAGGRSDVVELLLANKADINAKAERDLNHPTPLALAIVCYHVDVANLLLAHGASYTIHDMASLGDLGKVAELLKGNPSLAVSIDDPYSRQTPLHRASQYGHRDVAKLLLTNKADINAKDCLDETPLHSAIRHKSKDVVELLVANKADVNAKSNLWGGPFDTKAMGVPTIHYVVRWGDREMVELLLAYNADVNAKDKNGITPMQLAESLGNKEVAELLCQHGGK